MLRYLAIIDKTLMLIGYALIVSGILFFLENAQVVDLHWDLIWPIVLVGIGVYIVGTLRRIHHGFENIIAKIARKF